MRGVQADRPDAFIAVEVELDTGQRLREHQRGAEPLQDPGEDQCDRVERQTAQHRRHGEQSHAKEEDPAVPVRLAQPGAGDQQHRERDQVTADDQLQQRT
jgi:hypothetical protein